MAKLSCSTAFPKVIGGLYYDSHLHYIDYHVGTNKLAAGGHTWDYSLRGDSATSTYYDSIYLILYSGPSPLSYTWGKWFQGLSIYSFYGVAFSSDGTHIITHTRNVVPSHVMIFLVSDGSLVTSLTYTNSAENYNGLIMTKGLLLSAESPPNAYIQSLDDSGTMYSLIKFDITSISVTPEWVLSSPVTAGVNSYGIVFGETENNIYTLGF